VDPGKPGTPKDAAQSDQKWRRPYIRFAAFARLLAVTRTRTRSSAPVAGYSSIASLSHDSALGQHRPCAQRLLADTQHLRFSNAGDLVTLDVFPQLVPDHAVTGDGAAGRRDCC
jgi:hypothetical protein